MNEIKKNAIYADALLDIDSMLQDKIDEVHEKQDMLLDYDTKDGANVFYYDSKVAIYEYLKEKLEALIH